MTVRFERTSSRRRSFRGTPRQSRHLSSPCCVAPTSTKSPTAAVRTILPSSSMPRSSLPTGIRGLGGGRSSPGGGAGLPGGDCAQSRPPRRPSESARGATPRQVAKMPSGTVQTQRRPSECARAKRQHSRYSEMLRGMTSRACERLMPGRGPCLLSEGGPLGRGASTAGTEAQRRTGTAGASRPRRVPCVSRTLSESERDQGGR
mmetsp:Transcript_75330/g.233005  ORF Transcript_75330/g.233005 Transcript_75330/m.233005 type:complete len:204 (+) Transcript_75330:578-1189(+)